MWWDSSSNNFIFRGTTNKWRVASADRFYADSTYAYAYSRNLNARCPQDIEYRVQLSGKFTYENDLSVTKSKHDIKWATIQYFQSKF